MGGNALKTVGRIYKDEMSSTYEVLREHLYQALGLVLGEYVLCGSMFVRESSGDIDIAFDINIAMKRMQTDRNGITKRLNDLYVTLPEYKYNKGFDIHSIPFPIFDKEGKRTDRYVQVDIIPVENLMMARWGMETDGSVPWKSATRNGLLRAVAKHVDTQFYYGEDTNVAIYWDRYFYDKCHGLFKLRKSVEGKNGYILKTAKTISREFITDKPWEIVNFLLGTQGLHSWLEINNVYDVWNIVKESPKFDLSRFRIVESFITEMTRDGIDFPPEIKDWYEEQLEDGLNCK